jgi:hypothetical protein
METLDYPTIGAEGAYSIWKNRLTLDDLTGEEQAALDGLDRAMGRSTSTYSESELTYIDECYALLELLNEPN